MAYRIIKCWSYGGTSEVTRTTMLDVIAHINDEAEVFGSLLKEVIVVNPALGNATMEAADDFPRLTTRSS